MQPNSNFNKAFVQDLTNVPVEICASSASNPVEVADFVVRIFSKDNASVSTAI